MSIVPCRVRYATSSRVSTDIGRGDVMTIRSLQVCFKNAQIANIFHQFFLILTYMVRCVKVLHVNISQPSLHEMSDRVLHTKL